MNPFGDSFVQRVINMDRTKLYAIPQMSDEDFLMELTNNDDTLGGKLTYLVIRPWRDSLCL